MWPIIDDYIPNVFKLGFFVVVFFLLLFVLFLVASVKMGLSQKRRFFPLRVDHLEFTIICYHTSNSLKTFWNSAFKRNENASGEQWINFQTSVCIGKMKNIVSPLTVLWPNPPLHHRRLTRIQFPEGPLRLYRSSLPPLLSEMWDARFWGKLTNKNKCSKQLVSISLRPKGYVKLHICR